MKKINYILVSGIIALIVYLFVPVGTEYVDVYATVDNEIGFNVDQDALYFGTIPPGSEAKRSIEISHDFYFPKMVVIKRSGDIAQWLRFSSNYFWLDPHTTKNVSVVLTVPSDAEVGEYTSSLKIKFNNI